MNSYKTLSYTDSLAAISDPHAVIAPLKNGQRLPLFDQISPVKFNTAYDKNNAQEKTTQQLKNIFGDNPLFIQGIRKIYMHELKAHKQQAIENQFVILHDCLAEIETLKAKDLNPIQAHFLNHKKAKIQYEIGVLCMTLAENEAPISLFEKGAYDAISTNFNAYMENVQTLHQQFLDKHSDDTSDSNDTSQHFFMKLAYSYFKSGKVIAASLSDKNQIGSLNELDPYLPSSRQSACFYNMLVCFDELRANYPEEFCLENFEQLSTEFETLKRNLVPGSTITNKKAVIEIQTLWEQFKNPELKEEQGPNPCKEKPQKKARVTVSATQKTTSLTTMLHQSKPTNDPKHWFNTLDMTTHANSKFLRPRQNQDYKKILQALNQGHRKLLITKPTGTGKSALISQLIHQALENGQPAILVVPGVALVEQFQKVFQEYAALLPGLEHQHASYCPSSKSFSFGPITIITQPSFTNLIRDAIQKPLSDSERANPTHATHKKVMFHPDSLKKCLVVVDEAHHLDARNLRKTLEAPICSDLTIVGFSASTLLGEYPNLDKLFPSRPVTQILREAIQADELSALKCVTVDFSMFKEARDLRKTIRDLLEQSGSHDKEIQEEIDNVLKRNLGFSLTAVNIFVSVLKQELSGKGIVFCNNIEHATQVTNLLRQLLKTPVYIYHSKIDNKEQDLEAFLNDKEKNAVIVSVGALDEGFDCKDINVVLDFTVYIKKIRRIFQRAGRALRLRPDRSSCVYISTKILTQDLQIIPRKQFCLPSEKGCLGETDSRPPLQPQLFSLPNATHIDPLTCINPSPAKVQIPGDNKVHKLGEPPEDPEDVEMETEQGASASGKASARHSAGDFWGASPPHSAGASRGASASRDKGVRPTEEGLEPEAYGFEYYRTTNMLDHFSDQLPRTLKFSETELIDDIDFDNLY